MLRVMRSANSTNGGRRDPDMRWWSSLISSPCGMVLAALLLPGGLLVLAWMLYCRLAHRKRRIPVSQRGATPVSPVLTSPAPQHGPPAGDACGATAERPH